MKKIKALTSFFSPIYKSSARKNEIVEVHDDLAQNLTMCGIAVYVEEEKPKKAKKKTAEK